MPQALQAAKQRLPQQVSLSAASGNTRKGQGGFERLERLEREP